MHTSVIRPRLVAMSILPISPTTIGTYIFENLTLWKAYGSNNAGLTVHDSNPEMSRKMQYIGKKLNLKLHLAGVYQFKEIIGPCDIEGHLGTVIFT